MEDEEEALPWQEEAAKRVKQAAVALLVALCAVCLVVSQNPKVNSIDVEHLVWRESSCNVLAAGVEYKGTCSLDDESGKYNIRHGNFTGCSPFLWCADEGGMCACTGTVRYGSEAHGILTSKFVEVDVDGALLCSQPAFGQDPAAFRKKRCWCRPQHLAEITQKSLMPPTCSLALSMGDSSSSPLRETACKRSFLPWALVEVGVGNSTHAPEVRCAFQYGAAALSMLADTDETLTLFDSFGSLGRLPCYLLDSGEEGALDCVVAVQRPEDGLVEKWATWWTAHVAWRASVCWGVLGVAFLSLAPILAYRFKSAHTD